MSRVHHADAGLARVCEWAEPGLWDAAESVFRATVGKAARAFPKIPKQKAQNRPKTAKIQKRDEGFRLGVAVELVSMVTRKRACGLNPVRKRPATETTWKFRNKVFPALALRSRFLLITAEFPLIALL